MDDQLDDNLEKRIREVFDNYQDTSADEGWLLLREKFPEKAKRRPAFWLWASSIAALLLLFLGIMLFRPTIVVKQHLIVNKDHPTKNLISKTPESGRDSIKRGNDYIITRPQNENLADRVSHTNPVSKNPLKQSVVKQQLSVPARLTKQSNIDKNNSSELVAINQTKAQNSSKQVDNQAIVKKPDTGNISSGKVLATVNTPPTVSTPSAVTAPGSNTNQQPNNTNKPVFANNESKSKKREKNRDYDPTVHLGVYATSFFNYARGSSSQVNVGAGISSDIRLSKKFRLSTGIAISHNSLNYPTSSTGMAAPSARTDVLPQAKYAVANTLSVQNNFTVPNYIIKNNSAASLVGLDIPINLTYTLNPQKNDTYISAGLSSGTFVDEKYTFNYSYPSSFTSKIVGLPNQSTPKSFNSFYFAKTLNFSVGKAVRIGGNRVIVEPFIKYPLQGLGAQQIRFGSSGVNLKFNFLGH